MQQLISFVNGKVKKKGFIFVAISLIGVLTVSMLVACAPGENDTEVNTEIETTENITSPIIKAAIGKYVEEVEYNSIEIGIEKEGEDELVFKVFKISDEVRPTFESLTLEEGDEVSIHYYKEATGQWVLTKIEKLTKSGSDTSPTIQRQLHFTLVRLIRNH